MKLVVALFLIKMGEVSVNVVPASHGETLLIEVTLFLLLKTKVQQQLGVILAPICSLRRHLLERGRAIVVCS